MFDVVRIRKVKDLFTSISDGHTSQYGISLARLYSDDASKPGFCQFDIETLVLAMALMISTSIPYLPEPFWYSNGAKDESIEIV